MTTVSKGKGKLYKGPSIVTSDAEGGNFLAALKLSLPWNGAERMSAPPQFAELPKSPNDSRDRARSNWSWRVDLAQWSRCDAAFSLGRLFESQSAMTPDKLFSPYSICNTGPNAL